MTNDPIVECLSFFPVNPSPKGLIGFASVRFNGQLMLNCIAIYTRREGGIRCLFPVGSLPNGLQVTAYHPVTKEVTQKMISAIETKIKNLNQNVHKELPEWQTQNPLDQTSSM